MPNNPSDLKVGVIRIEGTNCEDESAAAFSSLGCKAEKIHLKQLLGETSTSPQVNLSDYDALYFPGGFSSGDYVRAGAIFAARIRSRLKSQVDDYINQNKPILGVCNGFQILVELGALPGTDSGISDAPEAVLHTNSSSRFECRPTYLTVANKSLFTNKYETNQLVSFPCAHAEGKLQLSADKLDELEQNGQVAFRYSDSSGDTDADYPWNPNGAPNNIAGITNRRGNVLGLMPHPERVFHGWQHTDWTSKGINPDGPGDGRPLFESVVDFLCQTN
tara:strand:+ start:4804 stop:5631 length:828 start_codon:yes stop_codon:yes gene_type:complete